MSSARTGGVPEPAGPSDPEAIRADIEATREELARTVDELSSRLDVRTRAKQTAAHAREVALDGYLRNPAGVAAAVLAVAVLIVARWRRRRAKSRRDS